MRIIKMYVSRKNGNKSYYCLFDKIPEVTYEQVGSDYVGSAIDEDGNIVLSNHLGYEVHGGAFGGREFTLKMKDGSTRTIKDHWFDYGSYEKHGEFIQVGGGTLKELQDCYVYCSYDIGQQIFNKMLDDYYSREREYTYEEIEQWCKLQYKWHDLIINGTKYPYMVNEKGDFVDKYTKKHVYVRHNRLILREVNGELKEFIICLFKLKYNNGHRLVNIERKMFDVLRESLPEFTDEQIIKNCSLPTANR